ncbi:MAG: CSLREA domain-containing protein [Anaerolineales bacterium]|nr:CSLREA domain-containing protein [Anaerolineales bacterium]
MRCQKKRWRAIVLVVLVIVPTGLLVPHAAAENVYYVSPDGDDANPGNFDQPWRTVQHAVDSAGPGDTIWVRGGIYNEGVVIETSGLPGLSITLIGYPDEAAILDGNGLERPDGIVIGGADYWTIQDLVIQDYTSEGERGFGFVSWYHSQGITLRNLEFSLVGVPIKFHQGGEDVLIEDVYGHDYDYGGFNCGTAGPCRGFTLRRVTMIGGSKTALRGLPNPRFGLGYGEGNDTAMDGFTVGEGIAILVEDCIAEGHTGDGFDFKSDRTTLRRVISLDNRGNNIKLSGSDSTLINSLSYDSGLTNLALAEGGSYTVINNTIANRTSYGYLAMLGGHQTSIPASISLHNNIFYNDHPEMGGATVYYPEGAILTADHNLYYNPYHEDEVICADFAGRCFSSSEVSDGAWYAETGNGQHSLYGDPLFVPSTALRRGSGQGSGRRNTANRDYHLTAYSPAIDAGTAEGAPIVDLDGVSRPQGEAYDIGAYEYLLTYVVNTTDDASDGLCDNTHCSLREAMLAANSSPRPNTIVFDIAGCEGVCTIRPASPLPALTDAATIIDGATQTVNRGDANPVGPEIEIDGTKAGIAAGFRIESANNIIKGLVINRFVAQGIAVSGNGAFGNVISGNYIGTDAAGASALGNGREGIQIAGGAHDNTIGGTTPEERNVISGNSLNGIEVNGGHDNLVIGNYIGADASGVAALANGRSGVFISLRAQGNVVGGTESGEGNVISGNSSMGVYIYASGTVSNTIAGNYIGADATGTAALGNQQSGVYIGEPIGGAQANTIGPSNVVAHNGGSGIVVDGPDTTGNRITENSITDNANLGIYNLNGGNAELAPPTITSATENSITGTACSSCTVEIFSDPGDEGQTYEGATIANGDGDFTWIGSVVGPYVKTTQTDGAGNTSEFSLPILPAGTATPTNTATPTSTSTPTATPTTTPTDTPTPTPTPTDTPTPIPTATPTPTSTATPTEPAPTHTLTATPTATEQAKHFTYLPLVVKHYRGGH